MEMRATVKSNNQKVVKKLLVAFFTEEGLKNRKIDKNKETEEITLEVEFEGVLPSSIAKAIASCGIVEMHCKDSESFDASEKLTSIEEEKPSTGIETEEISNSTNQTEVEETGEINENTVEEGSENTVNEKKDEEKEKVEIKISTDEKCDQIDFTIESFPKLKDVIDGANSEEDLAKKLSVLFNMLSLSEFFQKVFIASLNIKIISWVNIEKYLNEELPDYSKRFASYKTKEFFRKKYGCNRKPFLKAIEMIKDYYLSQHEKTEDLEEKGIMPCMGTKTEFLEMLDTINKDIDFKEKIKSVFEFMEKQNGTNTIVEEDINSIVKYIDSGMCFDINNETRIKITTILYAYTNECIKFGTFLTELKEALNN